MRLRHVVLVALFASPAAAQRSDVAAPPTTTISGVVRDSLAHRPLASAEVQLADVSDPARVITARSDSLGRYALRDVPDGRYSIGFFHSLLDSIGIEPTQRSLLVVDHRAVHADLATPSLAQLRTAVCGPRPAGDSAAVLVGIVRDARDGAPLAGVSVVGDWLELSFTSTGVVRHIPRRVATTAANGWFALCDVPPAGTIQLVASRDADSTDRVDVAVPADGCARRDLYLGPAPAVVTTDTVLRADSLTRPRRRRVGDGRLAGSVLAAVGGRPLAGAQLAIVDGPRTVADAAGQWTLVDVPVGTRVLEVRAIGYYPERRQVDVVRGAPPVLVRLSTLKAVLDTVRVTASRLGDRNGFQERRRSGAGRFLTASDIAMRQPLNIGDVFRTMSGLRVMYDGGGRPTELRMRGPFGLCSPAIYIDGMYFANLTTDDLNVMVPPRDIVGIEVYSDATTPAQFRHLTGDLDWSSPCGSHIDS